MKKAQAGFTIVELLIVIVVIAILAAISIVAYNGIQARAHNTAAISAVNDWKKIFTIYYLDKGPIAVTDIPEWNREVCLGTTSDYPAKDGFTAGACTRQGTTMESVVSEQLYTALKSVGNSTGATNHAIQLGDDTVRRGVTYRDWNRGELVYTLHGEDADCGISEARVMDTDSGTKTCAVSLGFDTDAIQGFDYPGSG